MRGVIIHSIYHRCTCVCVIHVYMCSVDCTFVLSYPRTQALCKKRYDQQANRLFEIRSRVFPNTFGYLRQRAQQHLDRRIITQVTVTSAVAVQHTPKHISVL